MPDPATPGAEADDGEERSRLPLLLLIGAIVLLPTAIVTVLVFSNDRVGGPADAGPHTSPPAIAGRNEGSERLLAALDPALGCASEGPVTIGRVDELVAGGALDTAAVPAPVAAVACAGDGITRDYVLFSRPEDAASLLLDAAAATGAPVATGTVPGCSHFIGAGAVVLRCDDEPDVVWTARQTGVPPADVLAGLR